MDLSNENIVHIKKEGIEYLQFKKLLEFENVVHAYTLRKNNINFRNEVNSKENLDKSMSKLCNELNIEKDSIIRPHQRHTDIVKYTANSKEIFENVDGLITDKVNVNIILSYADCTPILIYDPIKKIVGNIHSGWKGTAQKIGQKAVQKLIKEFDCKVENLIVCLGPAIGKCHFEVEEDVKKIFDNNFSYLGRNNDIIKKGDKKNKYYIDTNLINRLILEEVGVKSKNIIESNICTACNKEIMHSYRMDGEISGRNIALIGLKKG